MSASMSFLLALVTALCWGIAPLVGKLGLQRTDPLTGLALRSFVVSGCVLVLLLLTGHFQGLRQLTPRACLFLGLEGLLAALVGHFAYYYALKSDELAHVVPVVFAVVPAVAFVGGVLFLGEKVSGWKVAGLALVLAGIAVLRLAPAEKRPAPPAARQEAPAPVAEEH